MHSFLTRGESAFGKPVCRLGLAAHRGSWLAAGVLAAANDRSELLEDLDVLTATGPLEAAEYERLAEHGARVRRHAGTFP
jgi:hypothetical protein